MSVADARWLTSPQGRDTLAALPPYRESEALPLGERLRKQGLEPAHVAAALTQARLRERARDKLGAQAERLLLTPDGLEQATRPRVADRHAHRFAEAGVHTVWDMGCGLGSDALAFARAGIAVHAVEADEATAALAAANLAGLAGVRVSHAQAQDVLPTATDAAGAATGVWFDPARRTPGHTDSLGRTRRTFGLDQLSPSWEFVQEIAASGAPVGAKLSPGFPRRRRPTGAQAQWVSLDGEVLECALWWSALARTPGCTALVLRGESAHEVTAVDGAVRPVGSRPPRAGQWLYDPDRAVVRAGLVDALAAATDGAELGPDAGYVVAEQAVDVPWAQRYMLEQVLPATPKIVRAALRAEGIDQVTIKKRGTPVDPDAFRAKLRLPARGGTPGVLVLTRTPRAAVTLLVRPA